MRHGVSVVSSSAMVHTIFTVKKNKKKKTDEILFCFQKLYTLQSKSNGQYYCWEYSHLKGFFKLVKIKIKYCPKG